MNLIVVVSLRRISERSHKSSRSTNYGGVAPRGIVSSLACTVELLRLIVVMEEVRT